MIERRGGVTVAFFIEITSANGRNREPTLAERTLELDNFEAQLRPIRDRLSAECFGGAPVTIELCNRLVDFRLDKAQRVVMRRF